jgi:hypothetical protein
MSAEAMRAGATKDEAVTTHNADRRGEHSPRPRCNADRSRVFAFQSAGPPSRALYANEMREGSAVGNKRATDGTESRRTQTGTVPRQRQMPSPDGLHRTPDVVYETEGHRFESCRARSGCDGDLADFIAGRFASPAALLWGA